MGARVAARAAGEDQGAPRGLRELLAEEQQKREDTIEIAIPPGPRLGDVVVKAEHLRKAFGDNVLIDDLNFELPRGGIVGVIGPNGAGKTTLFRMIVGQEKPDGGTLRIGETVKLAYVDQSRDSLDGDKTVFEEIAQGAEFLEFGKRKVPARAYVAGFNFKGTDQQKRVRICRAASATACTWPSCCGPAATCSCSTSRPTISTSTRCARSRTRCWLSPGCAVVISHDRWFLDRIATHILAFEGDSQVGLVRGQLPGLRGRPQAPPRRGRRSAASDPLQEADALTVMIPYEELDRALARWKAKARGGVVEAPPPVVEERLRRNGEPPPASEGTPVVVDEMGSVPQPVDAPERTGGIDLAEIETYDD